jgi:hypothetical protein
VVLAARQFANAIDILVAIGGFASERWIAGAAKRSTARSAHQWNTRSWRFRGAAEWPKRRPEQGKTKKPHIAFHHRDVRVPSFASNFNENRISRAQPP